MRVGGSLASPAHGRLTFTTADENLTDLSKPPTRSPGPLSLAVPLVDLARNATSEGVRLGAAKSLLDRGYGKPQQSIDLKADVQRVSLNLFADFSDVDERLAAETPAAISANPPALLRRAALSWPFICCIGQA